MDIDALIESIFTSPVAIVGFLIFFFVIFPLIFFHTPHYANAAGESPA